MFLEKINSPEDVRKLKSKDLPALCAELRDNIIDVCSHNPGHLASSLGAVEIITGLHYIYNTPEDKIVFDVGHQAYAHKLLTGRREAFGALRTPEGVSGFPKRSESEYDVFGAGHSSTSISAALGIAEAARITGSGSKTIAVIGDGALTGGMAFEALNNAATSDSDLLIVLNDNNQSIDPIKGGIHNSLLRITTSAGYNKLKDGVWKAMGENALRQFVQRWIRSLKSWLVKRSGGDLFESFGIRYFGPVDGNDIRAVVEALRRMHNMEGPRILHCLTTKGKGFKAAEEDPVVWHAPGKFEPSTGERIVSAHSADRYQDVFGEVLCELARADKRVVGITPAMASGCGMIPFSREFPERFFDVGIEEEHAVTFSAGLAAGGVRPFCNIYSSFSQRAYDQIIHDIALQSLPVVICLDRAGLVGEDGATHHGAFDLAAYRSIPGTTVCAPKDETELKSLMYSALQSGTGPYIIRYPRGTGPGTDWRSAAYETIPTGSAETLKEGSELAIIAEGPAVLEALDAAKEFPEVGVYNFRFIKPLDTALLDRIAGSCSAILTLEDGCLKGGLYGAVCEYLQEKGFGTKVYGHGIPDEFIEQDRQSAQRKRCGLDAGSIRKAISEIINKQQYK